MKKFLYYFFININDFLDTTFNIDFRNLQIIRGIIGGVWYKQTMSGELPNCYGSWWTQSPLKPHRHHFTEKIENYATDKGNVRRRRIQNVQQIHKETVN